MKSQSDVYAFHYLYHTLLDRRRRPNFCDITFEQELYKSMVLSPLYSLSCQRMHALMISCTAVQKNNVQFGLGVHVHI